MPRPRQNKALKDLQELVSIIRDDDFEAIVAQIIMRDTFVEKRRAAKWADGDPEKGTPPPHVGDPTGEEAVSDKEQQDALAKSVRKLASDLTNWLAWAKNIRDRGDFDPMKRAERTVPDCLACGDPIPGRVRSGFDGKCFKRWNDAHRPDRYKFIAKVKSEIFNPEMLDDE